MCTERNNAPVSSRSPRSSSAWKPISKAASTPRSPCSRKWRRGNTQRHRTDAAQTARQLANVGQADAPDVLQSEVEQEQAALDTLSAERHYIAAFHQLAATPASLICRSPVWPAT